MRGAAGKEESRGNMGPDTGGVGIAYMALLAREVLGNALVVVGLLLCSIAAGGCAGEGCCYCEVS